MRFVGYVKGLAEGYAIESEDSVFEVKHLKDVAYFSEKLAIERQLDPNLALIIAYGHDLGRLKNGVNGKGHSIEGEKIMAELLKTSEIDSDACRIIKKAIRHHNQKSKIHSPYCELIKDADALAHNEEGIMDPDDGYEYYRIIASDIRTVEMRIAPIENWAASYSTCLSSILENLRDKVRFLEKPNVWVHEQRILIRQARAIIWYFKKNINRKENAYQQNLSRKLSRIDEALKTYFMTLREARQYFVYSEKEIFYQGVEFYREKYLKSIQGLESQFGDQNLIKLISEEAQYDYTHLSLNPQFLEATFIRQRHLLIKASVDDIKNLHEVRISGKKFKYMCEMGLISYNHDGIKEAIERLHDHIGKLNDYSEIMKLEKWKKHFNASEISTDFKKHQRKCQEVLFFFQLISNSSIMGTYNVSTQTS